jgi:hypothetical protein
MFKKFTTEMAIDTMEECLLWCGSYGIGSRWDWNGLGRKDSKEGGFTKSENLSCNPDTPLSLFGDLIVTFLEWVANEIGVKCVFAK